MPHARSARPGPADATQPEVLIGGDLLVDKSDDVQLARLCRPFVSWASSVAGVHHSIAGNGELSLPDGHGCAPKAFHESSARRNPSSAFGPDGARSDARKRNPNNF